MKKSIILFLVLSMLMFIAKAQDQDYIEHKIKSGESLYALTKKYKVSLDEIKKANPELGAKIDIGTVVKIPKKGTAKKTTKPAENKPKEPIKEVVEPTATAPEGDYIKHKLKSKESFAALSRKYVVSIADIKKANPTLGKTVKVGTIINIPKRIENTPTTTEVVDTPKEVTTPVEVVKEESTPTTSEEVFIYHKVKSKETLSTIAKKYKKTLAQIKKTNPSIGSKGLKIGQIVKISTGKKVQKQENVAATPKEQIEDVPSLPNGDGEITHQVKSKQTLFSIAKEYKVSVNDIKKWNNLTGASHLKLGQNLIIKTREDIAPIEKKKPKEEIVEAVTPVVESKIENVEKPAETKTVKTSGNSEPDEPIKQEPSKPAIALKEPTPQPEVDPDKIKVTTSTAVNASGYSKITETGLAELMIEQVESNKFLAFHKTAPIGTLIQVKNPMTGVAIFVRIIGKLPDNSNNDKIVIKVTKKVRERIGALNNRFPVEISYIP